ncbi:MAG: hypothetical protein AAGU19_13110 [Prolixibacteraceae bacterium]
MKHFLRNSIILAMVLLTGGYLLFTLVIPRLFTPVLVFLLFFIFVVTNIVYAWLFTTLKKNNRRFTTTFMALNVAKMFIYLVVVVGSAWLQREHAKEIMIGFLVMYIAFSVLEVVSTLRLVKKDN